MKWNDDTFYSLARAHYDNPQCHSVKEFEDDLKRFLYLRKLFGRYDKSRDLQERLIVNHLVVLYNVFGKVTTTMLYFKIDREYWSYLTTTLVFLNRLPEVIEDFGIITTDIPLDTNLIQALRNL